ncbi:hypothetical protein [Vermiculatibacterium agrestimuris]|uniref:hypothetical protein n=1 Tax=Vermiculatibacterium agrestimuris TaxID=2941519 RepID=UPI00203BAB11|nr:hypothetical protein [Vermiculatibacterium agrestimuris]
MERLTKKDPCGLWITTECEEHCDERLDGTCKVFCMGEAIDRLAAYEDAMTLERVQELAQAEKDGRLVVQDVFSLWPIECDVCERNVDGHGCKGLEDAIDDSRPGAEWTFMAKNCPKQVYRVHTTSERLQLAWQGKADIDGIRYFLTKQDAEEALREERGESQ